MLYDQIVEFAREKHQMVRRRVVHKGVPRPIVVMVVGDSGRDALDLLSARLTSRWTSQLEALQVCYACIDAPYEGERPILQARLERPEEGSGGPGCLCRLPETLAAVNDMAGELIRRLCSAPRISMQRADVHIILAPEDPASPLLSDLAAVIRGRLEEFGAVGCDCRLYLLLPQRYETAAQRERVCGVMDQLSRLDSGPYRQAVLMPQADDAPRPYEARRLVDAVMLLDDMNERYQCCNTHGERLELLVDLVENGWLGEGFIQTAGEREGSAGPEYWLAQAVDTLCRQVLAEDGGDEVDFDEVKTAVTRAVETRMKGMEQALGCCCLFHRGQVERLSGSVSLDEAEQAVFGGALEMAYKGWLEERPPLEVPEAVSRVLKSAGSAKELERLAERLQEWGERCGETVPLPRQSCQGFNPSRDETESAARFRNLLCQTKYALRRKQDEQRAWGETARLCAESCRERARELAQEREDFSEFARQVQEAWYTLRDSYNGGSPMPLSWVEAAPSMEELRRAGARAAESGDAREVLSLAAQCVDLSGGAARDGGFADPLLFCRIPITMGLNTWTRRIDQGISEGRMLKLAIIANSYSEAAVQRVDALASARQGRMGIK